MENAKSSVEEIFADFKANHKKGGSQSALVDQIRDTFGVTLSYDQLNPEALIAILQNDITQKEMLVGKPNFNMFIRTSTSR